MRRPARISLTALAAASLVACLTSPEARGTSPRTDARPLLPDPGPPISEACLEAAERGALVPRTPFEVGGYRGTRIDDRTLYFKRTGRPLTEAEGDAVFSTFRPAGMQMGSSGLWSIFRCPDVARSGCLRFVVWLCQTSLERVTGDLDAALTRAGAADGEVGLLLEVLEARGPKCKRGEACRPLPHYAFPAATNDPTRSRRPVGRSIGRCERDGGCEGPGNRCAPWYLQGGIEPLIAQSFPTPRFCGCVEGACTWFEQP